MKISIRTLMHSLLKLMLAVLLSLLVNHVHAALISRTITVDGDMSEWFTSPAIPSNAGQFSTDCQTPALCEGDAPVGSTGRDLETFSFTWDDDYIYFYVTRYASTSNTTDWLFYLDEDADGLMQADERIFRVGWQGSNRSTSASLCPYEPLTGDGDDTSDPISNSGVGDGYDMPGDAGTCTSLYTGVTGGSTTGLQMESRMAWADIGLSGPQNILFHISSSTGVNLPTQVIDNMTGPGGDGGQFFPPDMSIDIIASSAQVYSGQTVTFDVTLTNVLYDDFSNIDVSFTLPAGFSYQSHVAPVGTTFNSPYNLWEIPLLAEQDVLVLQVTALAQSVVNPTNTITSVSLTVWTGTDTDAANNDDSVGVQILPIPELLVTKAALPLTADPNTEVVYTSTAANISTVNASTIVVTEELDQFSSFKIGSIVFDDHAAPYDPSTLTLATTEYFNGVSWAYTPVSGAGGAPPGYDANVKQIRFTMSGTLPPNGAFSFVYVLWVN